MTVDLAEQEVFSDRLDAEGKRAGQVANDGEACAPQGDYPPDKQEKAAQTVLQQAETLCRDWAA